jgi:hypothetical protein
MSRKVMKLVDPWTSMMECQVCGAVHQAMLRGGGHFYRGSWQCQNGCKLPDRSETRRAAPDVNLSSQQ